MQLAKPDICPESRFLPTLPAFDAPVRGSPSEYCHEEQLEWFGYPMVKKCEDTFIRFDRVHERDRQTPRNGIGRAYA